MCERVVNLNAHRAKRLKRDIVDARRRGDHAAVKERAMELLALGIHVEERRREAQRPCGYIAPSPGPEAA